LGCCPSHCYDGFIGILIFGPHFLVGYKMKEVVNYLVSVLTDKDRYTYNRTSEYGKTFYLTPPSTVINTKTVTCLRISVREMLSGHSLGSVMSFLINVDGKNVNVNGLYLYEQGEIILKLTDSKELVKNLTIKEPTLKQSLETVLGVKGSPEKLVFVVKQLQQENLSLKSKIKKAASQLSS